MSLYLASVVLLAVSFSIFSCGYIKQAHADSTISLTIKYANDTSQSNIINISSGEKYALSQEYSWVRDQTSRYNLEAYSIDNGPYVNIPRVARGNFTLDVPTDSNHEITFLTAIQYPIEIVGVDSVSFLPASPTNDNWFDINSDEQISVPYVIQSDDKNTREQLKGWSYDGEDTLQIQRLESGVFTTPQIHVSNSHSINFVYVTQYYLSLNSEYGHVTGAGWYDSGTTAVLSSISNDDFPARHVFSGWNGPVLNQSKPTTSLVMGGPITITANWTVDYTPMTILGALVVGIGSAILYKKRRTRSSQEIAATIPEVSPESAKIESMSVEKPTPVSANRISDDVYSKEIDDYIVQKSMERLELFETSGVISKEKIAKIKENIAKSESD
jgi:hypothetical protein